MKNPPTLVLVSKAENWISGKLQFFLSYDPDSKRSLVPMSKFLEIVLSFKVKVEVDFF